MKHAFELMINFAISEWQPSQIIGKTGYQNTQAIRMAEKLGFKQIATNENEAVLLLNCRLPGS
jgi:hypothetical protein